MQKTDRRSLREQAVKALNKIVLSLNVGPVPMRASGDTVTDLWESLCDKATEAVRQELASARESWMGNGGCELDAELLVPSGGAEHPEADKCVSEAQKSTKYWQLCRTGRTHIEPG